MPLKRLKRGNINKLVRVNNINFEFMNRLFFILSFALLFASCKREENQLPVVVNDDFKIEVTELTTATIKATITPKDKDMIYGAQVEAINDIDLDWRVNTTYADSERALLNIGVMGYVDYAIDNDIDILEFITEYNVGGK